jgi:hypothetical protein
MTSRHRRATIFLFLLLTLPAGASAQTLSEALSILSPLAGKTWVGRMTAPDGQHTFAVERTFQAIWDGSVVKFSSSGEIGSPAEGYFYWDREAKKLAVFIISARGVCQRGTVSAQGNVITVEGRISFPERTFDYRNTFELRPDGSVVDRWFQNALGDWRAGHVVELKPR